MAQKTSTHKSEPLQVALQYLQSNYILPSFQRDYVWKMEQIEELFNSIYRGYPFGTMLFWHIKPAAGSLLNESFYHFITDYYEGSNIQANTKIKLIPNVDYWVVLDGQQRLTSLNIGLLGSYFKRARYQRKDNQDYPEYKLYMLVSHDVDNPFKFIKVQYAGNGAKCFIDADGDKWLLVNSIFIAEKARDLEREFSLDEHEGNRVYDFKEALDRLNLNFSEMTGFDYNEATNVFVKVNSGGTVLAMSDILNSIIVSTWKAKDAKASFKNLIGKVDSNGFVINTNYIVKAILFLHHVDVRFQIQGFTDFVSNIEDRWDEIDSAVVETFSLLKSYGLNHSTLGGYNVTLPVLYYIYHSKISNAASAANFENDRKKIKKWLLSAILLKVFSGSSDFTLRIVRSVFTDKVAIQNLNGRSKLYTPAATTSSSGYVILPIKQQLNEFPSDEMNKALGDEWYISDSTLEELITDTQKGERYSLPVLALLYPDYNLTAVEYEQDHLHPMARFKDLPADFATAANKTLYNSIVNLQLLEKTPNIQKSDKKLKEWVDEQTQNGNRKGFLDAHLIPDVSLDEKDIADFFEKRKELLVSKLKESLGLPNLSSLA